MSKTTKILDRYLYPDYQDNWDIHLFEERISKYLNPECTVLDLGAGAGKTSLNIRGQASLVCGVDLDERVLQNPYLDEAKIAPAESIPYADNYFDVVICMHVLEHLRNPEIVFKEAYRVLKPDGLFLIKTPNKFHYAPFLGRATPTRFHKFYNKIRHRDEDDTFPTYYKANSEKQIKRLANSAGFSIKSLEIIEGRPEYLRITWPTYLLGTLYERIVNSTSLMRHFRAVMLVCLYKDKRTHFAEQSAQQKSKIGGISQCVVSVDTRDYSRMV